MTDASGYIRLSRAAREENLSLAGMIRDVEGLAERLGVRLLRPVHVDDGESGAVRDRPEFVAWLADAREGRAQLLLTHHVDRLTREGLNVAAMILDTVEGKDVVTGRSVTKPVRLVDCRGLDSEHGAAFRFQFVIGAEVARAERERMVDRNRAMRARAKEAGRYPGGAVPYGFRAADNPDGPGRVLVVDEAEAEVLHRVGRELRDGMSPGAVARGLNEDGVRPRRAERWRGVTVRSLVYREGARLIWTPGELLQMRRLLEVKDPDARKGGRPRTRLLSGLLVCGGCRRPLQVGVRQAGRPQYRCQTRPSGGACPAPVSVGAEAVEQWAEARFLGAFGRVPFSETVTVAAGVGAIAELEALEASLSAALVESLAPDLIEQVRTVRADLAHLRATAPATETVTRALGPMAEVWAARDTVGRRALLASYWAWIEVGPGVRGPHGLDPDRLEPVPHELVHGDAGDEY